MEFLQAGGTVDGGWSGRKLAAGLKNSAMAYQLTLASICYGTWVSVLDPTLRAEFSPHNFCSQLRFLPALCTKFWNML